MEKEEPVSDSDSDGLPELCPPHAFDKNKLKKGDVVWAVYKDLHWPALVRDVDKKNKKLRVWYLDSPGKCFNVSFNKIHDFDDGEFTKKVQEDAKLHPFGQKHVEVLKRTEIYMFRGMIDDPMKMFDTSQHYLTFLKLSEKALNTKNVSIDNNDNLKKSNEVESFVENDEDSCTSSKYSPEPYVEDCPYEDEMEEKILSYITSGQVDNYLIDVANSNITNERHKLFIEAMKKDQLTQFWETQSSIPINSQKLPDVTVYLNNLYEQKIGKGIPQTRQYIISVWLPEAVSKAISLIEAEPLKQLDKSFGTNESTSPFKAGASDLTVDSSSNKFSHSQSFVESSKLLADSSSGNVSCAAKRKLNLPSCLIQSQNSNELEIEAHTTNKKKSTRRKNKKRPSTNLRKKKKRINLGKKM